MLFFLDFSCSSQSLVNHRRQMMRICQTTIMQQQQHHHRNQMETIRAIQMPKQTKMSATTSLHQIHQIHQFQAQVLASLIQMVIFDLNISYSISSYTYILFSPSLICIIDFFKNIFLLQVQISESFKLRTPTMNQHQIVAQYYR